MQWAVDGRQHSLYVHRMITVPGYHRVGELVIPVPTLSQAAKDETSITIGYTSTSFKAGITEITVERAVSFPTEEMVASVTQGTAMDQLRHMRDSISPHGLLMANLLLAKEMTRPPEAE